jgi:hypothetical protein
MTVKDKILYRDLGKSLLYKYTIYDFDEMYDNDGFVRFQKNPFVLAWREEYVFKLHGTIYEMNMIQLAGDCAVPVLGPAMQDGRVTGFVMRREKPLESCLLSKREIMYKIIELVSRLHGKGIIHGDIKLHNMLLCSDGKIRLCDFGGAILEEHSAETQPAYTWNYLSPYRVANLDAPFSKEDDLYALGISIWDLYTGKHPLPGKIGPAVREAIRAGFVVDLSEIEDEEARQVAEKLMSHMLQKSGKKTS